MTPPQPEQWPGSSEARPTLEQCLLRVEPARLRVIAEHWGVAPLPGSKPEVVAALSERMLAPGAVERAWQALTPDEQAALESLRASAGRMAWPTFTRRWGQVRLMGPGRMARERPWESPLSPTEGLWYRGLVFRLPLQAPTGLYEAALVPAELEARFPISGFVPPFYLQPAGSPAAVCPASDNFLDDACTLLSYLQNHAVAPGADGRWPAPDTARLTRRLRDRDPGRLALLHHLAHRLGWLRTDPAGHLRPDPQPVAAWLQSATAEQRRTLAQAWRDDPSWNDLWHVPTLRPDDTGSWHNDALLARQAILRYLASCQPGEWYAVAAFVAAVKEADPDFQRPDGDYSNWYIRDAATGEYHHGFASWDAVEGALIRYLITGPLFWLGLSSLGGEQETNHYGMSLFCLSGGGADLMRHAEAAAAEPEPAPLVVRPDLTILIPAPLRYERFQVSRVADWVRVYEDYVYRLTASSLARAQEQKISTERIVAFLQEVAGKDVPRTVSAALARWAQRGTQVRLEQGVLLRVKNEEVMRQVAAHPATRRFIREVIGPRAALVTPGGWPRLARALVELGWVPDLSGVEETLDDDVDPG